MNRQERIYAGNIHMNDAINVDDNGRPFQITHLGIYIQTCEKRLSSSILNFIPKLDSVMYNTYDILNELMDTKDAKSASISKFINDILMNALNYDVNTHTIIDRDGSPVEHIIVSIDPSKDYSDPVIIDFLIELITQCYYLASSEMMYAMRQLAYYMTLFFHNLLLRIPEDRINDILIRLHELCPRESKIATNTIKDMHDNDILPIILQKMRYLINIINDTYSIESASRDIIEIQRKIEYIIATIENETDMNITINAFDELLAIMEIIKRNYIKIDPKKITILIPSCHVNAPVGRNVSFNYIRKNSAHFKDYIWMGSDDDDRINIDSISAIKTELIQQRYDISKIVLTQPYQRLQNKKGEKMGIARYAAWSYMFSPIYYNNISYRCAPMNKEDLDFFNRLVATGNYIHSIHKDEDVYEYDNSNNKKSGDIRYEKYIPFHDPTIIEYMNLHNESEHDNYDKETQNRIAPSMSIGTVINSKKFYVNDATSYIVDKTNITVKQGHKRAHRFGLKNRNNTPKKPPRAEFFSYRQYDPNTNENLNGDCYMITYKAIDIDETNENVTYNIMFQNGKTFVPESIIARLNEVALSNNIDEHTIDAIISLLQTESIDSISEDILTYMRHWNNELLKDTEERSIPMLMYGSSIKNTPPLMILLIILLASMAIIMIVILACTIRNHVSKSPNCIPFK